ncbi:hypothetical protein C0989_000278 [Termitomyces sp. Mn162]|nr:hypothetical protein C0989_000278 [Termitomyces sp. Mn162]
MAIFPDKFTICELFLKEIPSDMLVVLICNGRLAPKVNTVKEFVSEAKVYENSIKTAMHYLEHSIKSQLGWQLLLAAVQSLKFGTDLAKRTEVAGHHVHPQPSELAKRPICGKVGHFAHKCRELAKLAPQVFVQTAHTAAPLEMEDANDEQEEEPAEAIIDNTVE